MLFDNPVNRLSEYIGAVKASFDLFEQRECVPFQANFIICLAYRMNLFLSL